MAKCKKCPRWRVCRGECYGESPCEFALAFDRIGKRLDIKTACVESMRAERDEGQKRDPVHRIYGDYVLTPVQNAFNQKTSWWISKRGFSIARYCFTASSEKEVDCQTKNGISGYINLLDDILQGSGTVNRTEDKYDLSGTEILASETLWEETQWNNWKGCPHCGSLVQQPEDYSRSGLYRFCPRCGKETVVQRTDTAENGISSTP